MWSEPDIRVQSGLLNYIELLFTQREQFTEGILMKYLLE